MCAFLILLLLEMEKSDVQRENRFRPLPRHQVIPRGIQKLLVFSSLGFSK
jgi:hypothetical protein